jgi:hypothetical protein
MAQRHPGGGQSRLDDGGLRTGGASLGFDQDEGAMAHQNTRICV